MKKAVIVTMIVFTLILSACTGPFAPGHSDEDFRTTFDHGQFGYIASFSIERP